MWVERVGGVCVPACPAGWVADEAVVVVVEGAGEVGVEWGIGKNKPLTQSARTPAPHQSALLSGSKTLRRKSCLRWLGR